MRRLSFFTDWRTGLAVPSPQVSRMVQVLVQPITGFRDALMADQWINLNDQIVNWTEDNPSHDTPGVAEQFWWPMQSN